MLLDTHTTLVYHVIAGLTLAILQLVAFWGRFTPSIRSWISNLLFQSAGWWLILFQDTWDPIYANLIGPTLLSIGFALMIQAIYQFYGRPLPHSWHYWPCAVVLLVCLMFIDNRAGRQISLNLCYAFQIGVSAVFLLRQRDPYTRLHWLMGGSALIGTILVVLRALILMVNPDQVSPISSNTMLQSLTFSLSFILRMVFTVGFLLLMEAHRYADLQRLATLDDLTGIYNRRAFMERAECCVRPAATGHPHGVSILLLDLDHFKTVNDVHGHQAGDQTLQQLSAAVRTQLRPNDVFGRYGGEEFCICAPGLDQEQAWNLAERIRLTVAAQPIHITSGQDLRVTTSIGVVWHDGHSVIALDHLLARADNALYAAKRLGRNRVEHEAAAITP